MCELLFSRFCRHRRGRKKNVRENCVRERSERKIEGETHTLLFRSRSCCHFLLSFLSRQKAKDARWTHRKSSKDHLHARRAGKKGEGRRGEKRGIFFSPYLKEKGKVRERERVEPEASPFSLFTWIEHSLTQAGKTNQHFLVQNHLVFLIVCLLSLFLPSLSFPSLFLPSLSFPLLAFIFPAVFYGANLMNLKCKL